MYVNTSKHFHMQRSKPPTDTEQKDFYWFSLVKKGNEKRHILEKQPNSFFVEQKSALPAVNNGLTGHNLFHQREANSSSKLLRIPHSAHSFYICSIHCHRHPKRV